MTDTEVDIPSDHLPSQEDTSPNVSFCCDSEGSKDHELLLPAKNKNGIFHPILKKILLKDYSSYQKEQDDYFFYGDFQILNEFRTFYGSKFSLYNTIKALIPHTRISYPTFCDRTRFLIPTNNRTDLCSYCRTCEVLMSELKRTNLQPSETQKEFLKLW